MNKIKWRINYKTESIMDYVRYIAASGFLMSLEEKKQKLNVSSGTIVGELNKKIKVVKAFLDQEEEILFAEITTALEKTKA